MSIKLRNLKNRKNINFCEEIKRNFQYKINEQLIEVVFNPGRMCKWPEDPLIIDPDDPADPINYTAYNLTIREINNSINPFSPDHIKMD